MQAFTLPEVIDESFSLSHAYISCQHFKRARFTSSVDTKQPKTLQQKTEKGATTT